MNNNSKKSIFTKKNIIIGVSILLVVFILIYFIFLREPKEKLMKCTMSIENYEYAEIDMTIDAYYSNKVNRVEGKVNFNVTDETIKTNIDKLEQNLQNYYKSVIKGDSININVYKENFNIIMDYNIDYTKIKEGDIESFNLFPVDGITDKIAIDQLKEQILKSGGSCVEG